MSQPRVSILIPAYNAAPWLAQTLQSALAQTWPATEIIVVDDGSRDDTLAIAKSFDSAKLKVIHQDNRGQCASENRAFAASQGEFVDFLDADDAMAPDKIAVQMKRLMNSEPGYVAACSYGRFVDKPENARFVPEPSWADMASIDWLICSWSGGGMMHGAAWLIPRSVIDTAGPWNETLSQGNDFDFFCRVLLASRGLKFCLGTRTFYRSVPTSMGAILSPPALDSLYRARELGTAHLLAAENSARTRRAAADCFRRLEYESYQICPTVCSKAGKRVRELGGSAQRCPGGRVFRVVETLAGWKLACRLRRAGQTARASMRSGRTNAG
jgi:glycosyltransferase involved in cell wall biosynthesis